MGGVAIHPAVAPSENITGLRGANKSGKLTIV
jgi:hypothetical protein